MKKTTKGIIGLALVGIMGISAVGCAASNTTDTKTTTSANTKATTVATTTAPAAISTEAQLKLIAENVNVWQHKSFSNEANNHGFQYAVTDLDNNGRLEVISSVCEGSGHFTTAFIFEVSEDGKSLVACNVPSAKDGGTADLMVSSTDCFVNPESGAISFAYNDVTKTSAADSVVSKGVFSLENGQFQQNSIATATLTADGATYKNAAGSEITEDEFNNCVDAAMSMSTKKTATFGWTDFVNADGKAATELSADQLTADLEASFNGFSIK